MKLLQTTTKRPAIYVTRHFDAVGLQALDKNGRTLNVHQIYANKQQKNLTIKGNTTTCSMAAVLKKVNTGLFFALGLTLKLLA